MADRVVAALAWAAAATVAASLLWVLGDVLARGASGLDGEFLTTAPTAAGRAGGVAPMIVSTLLLLAVCLAVSAPLGLLTAVLLSELGAGPFARAVRRSLDALAAVPSIVLGLFGNAFFCQVLGLGFSILSGGLTLACMVLPLFIRTAEAGLRSAPLGLRQGAAALALSRTTTLVRLLLPHASPAIACGLVLGVGRALAETAALIFTSGYVDRMPTSLFDSGRALSVHVYDLAMNVAGGDRNAYASALVLIACVVAANAAATSLGERLGTPAAA